jgi:hypothetical protein
MVRHMKSILEPSLLLRVYGPTRSTHNASQGVVMTSLGGIRPYFRLCLLFTWQDLQRFDVSPDGVAHTFIVHHGSHCLFKTQVTRVLEVVVVPSNSSVS